MANKKTLLILLLVLAVAIAAFIIVSSLNQPQQQEETHEQQSITLSSMSADAIQSIEYARSGDILSFAKGQDGWVYALDEQLPIEQSKIEKMVTVLASIHSERLVTQDTGAYADFGLDAPLLSITVNGDITFHVGMKNTVVEGHYFNIQGQDEVYLVDASLYESFDYALQDLIHIEPLPYPDFSSVTYCAIENKNGVIELEYAEGGKDTALTSSVKWFIKMPEGVYKAADSAGVEETIRASLGLTLSKLVKLDATEEELESYGLLAPKTVVTVKYMQENEQAAMEEKEVSLRFGKTEEGKTYAMHSLSNAVVLVEGDSAEMLGLKKYTDYLYKNFMYMELSQVDSIEITQGDNTRRLEIKRESTQQNGEKKERIAYYIDGKEAASSEFIELFYAICGLKMEALATKEIPAETEPYMTITFHRNTDNLKEYVVRLLPYDGSFYLAQADGEQVILVNRKDAERIISGIDEIISRE